VKLENCALRGGQPGRSVVPPIDDPASSFVLESLFFSQHVRIYRSLAKTSIRDPVIHKINFKSSLEVFDNSTTHTTNNAPIHLAGPPPIERLCVASTVLHYDCAPTTLTVPLNKLSSLAIKSSIIVIPSLASHSHPDPAPIQLKCTSPSHRLEQEPGRERC
jgi:hypothetical protein